jgi:ribosomal protein S18 acetylase RimI-like enzyme
MILYKMVKVLILILLLLLFYLFINLNGLELFKNSDILNLERKDGFEQEYHKENGDEIFLIEYNSLDEKTINLMKEMWPKCFVFGEAFDFYKDTTLIMYYKKGILAGFVGMLTTRQLEDYLRNNGIAEHSIFGVVDQHGIYMYNLCTFPEFRKQGIGQKLVEGVIRFANDNRKTYINLVVFAESLIPLKMYRKFKFTEFHESTNAANNKKVITMVKYLRNNS